MKHSTASPDFAKSLLFWSCLGLFSFLPFFFYYAQRHPDDFLAYLLENDFQNIWLGARAALSGKIDILFDVEAYQHLLPYSGQFYFWTHPLHLLFFVAPLGLMPYIPALAVFSVIGLALYLYTARCDMAGRGGKTAMLLLATSPACIINLLAAQNSYFTAVLFLGGFYFIKTKRPVLAGILFGILSVKPQIGLIVPLALIILKQWRAFLIAALVSSGLAGLSFLIWGVEYWQMYTDNVRLNTLPLFKEFSHGHFSYLMASIYTGFRNAGLSFGVSMALQVVIGTVTAGFTLLALRREGLNDKTILLLALCSAMLTPYAFYYDLTTVTAALLAYIVGKQTPREADKVFYERLIFGALWALPMMVCLFRLMNLPLLPVIFMTAFWWVYREKTVK